MVDGVASVAGYIASVIAVVAGAAIAARRGAVGGGPIRRYLAVGLICLGLSVAITAPVTLTHTTSLDVVPDLVRVIADLCALLGAFCVMAMVVHTARPGAVARGLIGWHVVVFLVVVLTMLVLLAHADARTSLQLAATYADDLPAIGYQIIDSVYLATGLVALLWLIRHYGPAAATGLTRGLLRSAGAAAVAGLLGEAWKITTIVLIGAGVSVPSDQQGVSELVAALVVGGAGAACTFPAWVSWLDVRVQRYRYRRDLAHLAPLWRVLTEAVPQVALHTSVDSGVEFALHRCVIEIRDAQLALRRHVDPAISVAAAAAAAARGVAPGPDTDLLVEAAELAAGIAAYRAGTVCTPVRDQPPVPADAVSHDVSEIRWLVRLARAVFTDPLVTEVVAEVVAGHPAQRCPDTAAP